MSDGEADPSVDATPRQRLAMDLIATGDENRAAFLRLYRHSNAKLFGICLRICGEREAAEDVLQEVYLSIWRRAGSFDPDRASPITWMAVIARNRAIDWRRSRGLSAPAGNAAEAETIADPARRADEQLAADDDSRRLHLCIDALEDNQRAAIRSAFMGGLTYAELASRKGVPLGTMKSWVRRGLVKLRACLDDE